MKTLILVLMAVVLFGCTTFEYTKDTDGTETVKGKTFFKTFKDIHAKRDGFELDIGESTVDAPDVTGDMVCIAKLQAGQKCD